MFSWYVNPLTHGGDHAMSSYWDRFADIYTRLGQAGFYFRHRLSLIEGVEGAVLEVMCGAGHLVAELLRRGIDAQGVDLSAEMVRRAQSVLAEAGYEAGRIQQADVLALPFDDRSFDSVIVTGGLALLPHEQQKQALLEMRRVARRDLRLMESFELREGFYWGRLSSAMFDGMKPIRQATLRDLGMRWRVLRPVMLNAFALVLIEL